MAVKIRLKRLGKIRSPHYRIVVADSRTKRDGRAIEEIGKYHPKNDPSLIEVNSERAQYWLSVGAQPTEAVVALFKRTGDWQSFSGDTSPSGVEPQKEKANKSDAFNVALAEKGDEPRTSRTSKTAAKPADRPAEKSEDKPAEKSEDKPAEKSEDKPAEKSEDKPAEDDKPAEVEGTPAEAEAAAAAGVADAEPSGNADPETPSES